MTHAAIFEALPLRFTEREVSILPPDIAAFAGRPRPADHDEGSPLAGLVAAGALASRVSVYFEAVDGPASAPVFVTARAAPIPAIEVEEDTQPADVDAFILATQLDGLFVWPRRTAQRALALAVCLPLGLPDVAAAQAAAPVSAPAAAPVSAPAAAPVSAPAVRPVVAPAPPAPVVPPAPNVTPGSLRATVEVILKSMNGREGVVVARRATVSGLIIGVEGEMVTLIDYSKDGKIVMLPKSDILEIRGRVPPPPISSLPPRGTGMVIAGGAMVGVGVPLMLSGLIFSALSASYAIYLGLPQIVPAAALLGAGIPLLVFGTRRRRAHEEALKKHVLAHGRLLPTVGRTRHGGWTGGLVLRF